ncbi:chromosome segregation protein SMC [Lysobacter sp. HDW10]|uniref:chromosome segregation protein SMC n=1 Tax=Lysobacter sp. HDW10 TaxID=2714936 RepID=UPI001409EB58|nr:chromosome segregation protein SMC [Lysobacter sp. HDW10]QIK81640.1 chromosome segregation protein SMC [Lysobacter sp. HDW10]
MRLSTIKLAGFKSFVDPTTLHLPGNMTGVVGPNGCGKSNIIDAVRWVMGESSASRLRGDNATDVIFSGSTARKPVSQATVELIFDNSDHAITGEYASFNEISVKRTVGRDGQSSYFLNGTRCRRRDITDLFLGTGLGPRSYSIIEQGMISQIIEAKPEELRVYLEEAAGISKYKERRRETENRIRHTRENLDRLGDLREEVGKQLNHLARQAKQAEQYTAIQTEKKNKEAEWKALQFKTLDLQLSTQRSALLADETRLEQLIAEQREAERQIETGRIRHQEAVDLHAAAQAEVYRVGGQLARLEQQIQHQAEMQQRLHSAHTEAQGALGELIAHITNDASALESLREELAANEPALEALRATDELKQAELREVESQLSDLQQQWDVHQAAQAEAARAGDVERTRVDYLDRQVLESERRRERLNEERGSLDLDALAAVLAEHQARHDAEKASLEDLQSEMEARKETVAKLQEQQREHQNTLSELRKRIQQSRGRLASLEALQQSALGQEQGAALAWLQANQLASAARVGERLNVDAGWENAVEIALGRMLEAVLIDRPEHLIDALSALTEGHVALVDAAEGRAEFASTSLANKVRGPGAVLELLASIHAVESLQDAKNLLPTLPKGAVCITRAGERAGKGWVRIERRSGAEQGALLRESEIQALRTSLEEDVAREEALEQQIAEAKQRAFEADQAREESQRALYIAHRSVSELAGAMQGQKSRVENTGNRIAAIDQELAQLVQSRGESEQQSKASRAALETAVERMAELEATRKQLEEARRALSAKRDAARDGARAARETAHALALSVETQRTRLSALSQALERMGQQRGQLDQRLDELSQQLNVDVDPSVTLEADRQAVLQARVQVEQALAEARSAMNGIEHELREFEQTRQQREVQSTQQRESISERKLEQQALLLASEQLKTFVVEAGFNLEDVVNQLDDAADADVWGKQVAELEGRMRRLEPVNLAAISEHAEAAQRKEYLDAQDTDLTTALDTLEEAIRKIDRETRGRFKDTFDRVNAGVQELYPRLFGGGHAYLELTGEDLLDTGVAIMARPPGKRVSNISLLSGGEKAMTAVALVFAIFRLNPAPFCLLDEVDAPLDEANVGRFTAMVNEMSEQVQFLFVTHNKATMEAARQLAGVTMREPGVSRLVSVDLAEATRLVGA